MATNNMLNTGIAPMDVANGGTGVASNTAYAVLCGGTTATGDIQSIASVGTAGQILVSNGASNLPTFQTLGTALAWSGVAGTTQAAAVNNGYIIENAGQTTVTLPATAAIGSMVQVQGLGAGGWILAANTGQTIQLGSSATSTAGSLTSANQWDTVHVVCVVANTTWSVSFTLSSGLTVA